MSTFDIKRDLPGLYAPAPGIGVVDVPELGFLMADGHGDPNSSSDYADVVSALFTASYAIRALAKDELSRVHTVGPLEGLWSAPDLDVYTIARDKSAWDWTMLIVQPDWITADLAGRAIEVARRRKRLAALDRLRFERLTEGRCVQALHVGPYDAEGPLIARMHAEFMPANGLVPTGRHHEIYLSDPQRTDPAKLRTILRQPVTAG